MAIGTFIDINLGTPTQITRELFTNAGSSANIVGFYTNAFYGGTNFEIWTAATGGTQLTEGVDYSLSGEDTYYEQRAMETVYAGESVYSLFTVTNPTYQTGNIYITAKIIGTYPESDIFYDLVSGATTTSIDNTDSPYTIADAITDLILFVDSSGGNVTVNMPTLADNIGRNITIIHQVGGNLLTVDGEGAEQIGEMTSIEMPKQGDRLKTIGTTPWWEILEERLTCQLRLDTYAGYGSTDTTIMQFTNSRENAGNLFTENHSTGYNSGTEGLEITIAKSGKYSFYFTACSAAGTALTLGLSLDSSQLTTAIYSINVQDTLSMQGCVAGTYIGVSSWSGYLVSGSIIRFHAEAVVPGVASRCHAFATYEGN